MKSFTLSLLIILALVWAPTAGADIAPDPGDDDYTGETDDDDDTADTCTAEVQEEELQGFTCDECVSTGDVDCAADYEGTDYELVCFDEGGEGTTEVWCTEDDGDPGPLCAMSRHHRSALLATAVFALAVVVVTRRSR